MKRLLLIYFMIFLPFSAAAEENKPRFQANFKRVGVALSTVKVSNPEPYENSPYFETNSNTQGALKGVFDFGLEYEDALNSWNNNLYMEYGETKVRNYEGRKKSHETADLFLFNSEYIRKMWQYGPAHIGPFFTLGYQTEFTDSADARRNKTLRAKQGFKLYNGKYLTDIYAVGVEEFDFTYPETNTKTAYELGATFKYQLLDNTRFELESYYRDYMSYSHYQGTDLTYELSVLGRLYIKISETWQLEPYVSYFQAKDRETARSTSDFVLGLGFSYTNIFDL